MLVNDLLPFLEGLKDNGDLSELTLRKITNFINLEAIVFQNTIVEDKTQMKMF